MATYDISTITAAQAAAYSALTDSLSLGAATASQVSVAFAATSPEQVMITMNGVTTAFGAGIMGAQDLTFADGGRLFIGTDGADTTTGSAQGDALFGGQGADRMDGGAGGDVMQGNQGDDTLNGGAGNDTIYGGQGDDFVDLGSGGGGEANFANGNKGNDTIAASDGADTVLGGQGDDHLIGGSGGDVLDGNLGDDTIQGGPGADTISGEGGTDVMTGGGGADVFDFTAGGSGTTASAADFITDWTGADHIRLGVAVDIASFMSVAAMPGFSDYYGMHPGQTYSFDTGEMTAQNDMSMDMDLKVVAVQTTEGIAIYADTNGDHTIDLAIRLPGASLDAVSAMSFI